MSESTPPRSAPPPGGLAAPMPTRAANAPLAKVKSMGELWDNREFKTKIAQALPAHVNPDRMIRVMATAATVTPGLRDASLTSFVGACLTSSQLGLEPNTPLGQAYLIPFKARARNPETKKWEVVRTDINFVPGYTGLMDLSYRTGKVVTLHADVVWAADYEAQRFSWEYGSDAHLRHRPLYTPRDAREQPMFAYVHAKLVDGQAFLVWPWEDVLRTRSQSQGFQAAQRALDAAEADGKKPPLSWTEAPWVKHILPMGKKTMVRAISKFLPRSIELATAVHLDETQERTRHVDWSTVIDAQPIGDGAPDYIGAAAAAVDIAAREDADEDAAYQDQRGRAGSSAPASMWRQREEAQPKPQPERQDARPTASAQAAYDAAPKVYTPPEFEAVLIDPWGEAGDTFSDPLKFSQALHAAWAAAKTAREVEALLDLNADGIDAARAYVGGASILAALDEPRTFNAPRAETRLVAVPVPIVRDKPVWGDWAKNVKAVLIDVPPPHLEAWVEAQRAAIGQAPPASRMLVIRAIAAAMGAAEITPPEWLGSMQAAKPNPRQANAEAEPAQEEPPPPAENDPGPTMADMAPEPEQEPPPPPPPRDPDQDWADDMLRALAETADPHQIRNWMDNLAHIARMNRLARQRPALHGMVDAAFRARLDELKSGRG